MAESDQNMNPVAEKPWARPADEILEELDVSPENGLSGGEVESRLEEYGSNQLREAKQKSAWEILLHQATNVIMAVLAVGAILSFIVGNWVEGVAIIVVIIIIIAIGFFAEWSGRRSMEKLRKMGTAEATVHRDGQEETISSEDLVPGDIVILNEGDVITADLRLFEVSELQADESALTGESVPISKETDELEEDTELADRKNMLFRGTGVTRGSGEGIVVATGMDTAIGHISELAEEAEQAVAPLEERLNHLASRLAYIVIGVSVVFAIVGFILGMETAELIDIAIALAVSAIPEGLPIVVTIALARGMWLMAKRNALVKKPSSVETLGSTTVIFSDKTGTLTENQMTVTRIRLAEDEIEVTGEGLNTEGEFRRDEESVDPLEDDLLRDALEVGVLCNNASLSGGGEQDEEEQRVEREEEKSNPGKQNSGKRDTNQNNSDENNSDENDSNKEDSHDSADEDESDDEQKPKGEPLEVALLVAGVKAGIDRDELLEGYPQEREEPFSSDTKMMATFHRRNGGYRVAVKGSPEAILDGCTQVRVGEDTQDLGEDDKEKWLEYNEEMAEDGLRLVALATKEVDSVDAEPYEDLTLLALFGMLDPPREDVRDSIEACQHAGMRVIMVTGDHPGTARNVGKAVGLFSDVDRETRNGETQRDEADSNREVQRNQDDGDRESEPDREDERDHEAVGVYRNGPGDENGSDSGRKSRSRSRSNGDGDVRVMRGADLEEGEDLSREMKDRVLSTEIFARVTPKQKLSLIELYQNNGEIVAMTGDGVNDAPALQKADIGVAMGQRGTEVAQEAADIILQDDAFTSIVTAVEYGRIIFDNIRKFTVYLLSGNVAEVLAIAIAVIIGLPLPLLPLQILYVNMFNDVFPSLALGVSKESPGVMDRPPRDPEAPVLTRTHWGTIVFYGVIVAAIVLVTLWLALTWMGLEQAQAVTISFLTINLARLWIIFNMRSPKSGLLRSEVARNPFVWGAIALSIVLLLVALYVPFLADLLDLQAPDLQGWLFVIGMSLIPFILGQIARMTGLISGVRLTALQSDSGREESS